MKNMFRILRPVLSGLRWAQDSALWVLCAGPVIHLLGKSPITTALLVIPPVIRLVLYLRDGISPCADELVERFPREAAAILIGGVICHWQGISWGLPAAMLFLITSVFLMRVLRQLEGEILTGLSLLMEVLLLTVLCIICLIFSRPAVVSVLLHGLSLGARILLMPVIYVISAVIYGILWLGMKLFSLAGFGSAELQELTLSLPSGDLLYTENDVITRNPWPERIASVLLVLAVIAVAVFWIRRLLLSRRAARRNSTSRSDITRSRVSIAPAAVDRVAFTDRSPRAKIRRAYARFTRALQEAGHFPEPSNTSLEIQDLFVPEAALPEATRLRELYLRARYDTDGSISEAEATEAAALEKHLRRLSG